MAIDVLDWTTNVITSNAGSSMPLTFAQDATPIPSDGEIIALCSSHETTSATPSFPLGFDDVTETSGARGKQAFGWKKAASEGSATFTIEWDGNNEMAGVGWVVAGCKNDALHSITAPSHVGASTVTVTTADTTVAATIALMPVISYSSGGFDWSGAWDWTGSGATIGSSGLDVEPAPDEGGVDGTDDESAGDWAIATSTGSFVGVSAAHGGTLSDRLSGMIFVFEEESVAPTGAVPSRLSLLGVT